MRRIALALVVLVFPVAAAAQSSDFGVFLNTTNFKSATETDPELPGERLRIDFKKKMGYGLTYNRFISPNFSTELGYHRVTGDATANLRITNPPVNETFDLGEFRSNIWTSTIQWHFAPRSFISPYIGGGAAYFQNARVEPAEDSFGEDTETVKFKNKFGYSANAGINLAITRGMTLAIDARYTPYDAEESGDSSGSVGLDPLTISAGIRFKR